MILWHWKAYSVFGHFYSLECLFRPLCPVFRSRTSTASVSESAMRAKWRKKRMRRLKRKRRKMRARFEEKKNTTSRSNYMV